MLLPNCAERPVIGSVQRARRRVMFWPLPLITAFASMALLGCSQPVRSPADVPGRYVLTALGARDVIDVLPSGRYVHRFTPPSGGPVQLDSGRWYFNAPFITFHDLRFWYDYDVDCLLPPDSVRSMYVIFPVVRTFRGRLQLTMGDAMDAYVRTDRPEPWAGALGPADTGGSTVSRAGYAGQCH